MTCTGVALGAGSRSVQRERRDQVHVAAGLEQLGTVFGPVEWSGSAPAPPLAGRGHVPTSTKKSTSSATKTSTARPP
jgi:hypothetical protein